MWWVAACAWLAGCAYFGFPRAIVAAPRLELVEWAPELHKPTDMLANFGYYVLFGVVATRLGATPLTAICAAAGFSLLTELSQIFSMSRHPSATDLVVNTAGAVAGVILIRRWSR